MIEIKMATPSRSVVVGDGFRIGLVGSRLPIQPRQHSLSTNTIYWIDSYGNNIHSDCKGVRSRRTVAIHGLLCYRYKPDSSQSF